MNDVIGAVFAGVVMGLAVIGVTFLFNGSFDTAVVAACKERGYWQTGQTRVICHVKEVKK